MHYIFYKTTCLLNQKIYMGIHQQKTLEFDGYLGSGLLLNRAIEKYGEDQFKREDLFVFDTLEEVRAKEREIVDEDFCKRRDTYNISVGGTGGYTLAGYSDEVKDRIYKLRGEKHKKGYWDKLEHLSDEERIAFLEKKKAAMLHARIQPQNKGRKHSGQAYQNMINANHMRGKIYYTDGNQNILLKSGDLVPEGFRLGRTLKEHQKFKGHTKEVLESLSKHRKGKVWCNDGKKQFLISSPDELPLGCVLGHLKRVKAKKTWFNKDGLQRMFIEGQEPDGWTKGRGYWFNNGVDSKLFSDITDVPDGWTKGLYFSEESLQILSNHSKQRAATHGK